MCGEDCQSDYLRSHECGHGLQNIILGPLFPFVIAIPSAIKYQYYNRCYKNEKETRPYDSIWFEGQATRWGQKYILTDKF